MNRLLVGGLGLAVLLAAALPSPGQTSGTTGGTGTTKPNPVKPAAKKPAANKPAVLGAPTDPYAPVIISMMAESNEVLKDFESIIKLSTPADQKQWPRLLDYLDVFLIGVDRKEPSRLDAIYTHATERYRVYLPIEQKSNNAGLKKFLKENLDSLGIEYRQRSVETYTLKNAFIGWLRYKFGYAMIAEYDTDLPPNIADPKLDIAALIAAKYDMAMEGRNDGGPEAMGAKGQASRKKGYQDRRKEYLTTSLKKKDSETAEEFAVRKAFAEGELDEIERFYVEAERFLIGGNVDSEKHQLRVILDSTPLPKTAFAESVVKVHEKPDRYSSIERSKNPILSGRIDFPLDQMRIDYILKISAAMKAEAISKIDAGKERSDDEKTQAKKAVELFFAMLDAGAKTGRLNGFVESHSNASGKNTLVWSVVAADGNAALEILELLPKSGKGNKTEMNLDNERDVKIHKATAPIGFRDDFKWFFGEETAYVGTSKETLWVAAGEGALNELKAAIKKSKEEAKIDPEAPFLDGYIKLAPWTELNHRHMGTKGDVKVRERAIQAFQAGDDVLTIRLKRIENRIDGLLEGMPGFLRFIGAQMAEFTRNLDKK